MAIDSEFSYGYVVGQLVLAKSDGDDLNRLPDFLGQNAKVTFTRTQGQYVQPVKSVRSGIRALMVSHQPVVAGLMSDGTITGDVDSNAELKPDAKPGLWLVVGQYNVDFGGAFPSTTIEVTESHTEDSPLDIASTIGYKPAPNHVVTTVELPTGGEPGQVYGWTGTGIGWYTPKEGPSTEYIKSGPGRPDVLTTTNGVITELEPVGTEYRSKDGAGVGAYVWRKRPSGAWEVVDGDTGWRNMAHLIPGWDPQRSSLFMRRINAIIYVSLTVRPNPGPKWTPWTELPYGLRGPDWSQYLPLGAAPDDTYTPVGYVELSAGFQVAMGDQSSSAGAYYTYTSADVWLNAPVGTPGKA